MQSLDSLPTGDELGAVVAQGLPTPIPSFPYYTLPNRADMPVDDVIQRSDANTAFVDSFLESLRSSIWSLQRVGHSEDTVHPLVEMLVLNPMRHLAQHCGVTITTDRNSSDTSGATLGTKRPDVLAWLPSGVLAFKGEDKATDPELGDATRELSEKLASFTDAFFGTIPYQLCYALGGSQIAFFALVREQKGLHSRIPLTTPVSLATANGRSRCVRYVVNITRILVKMQEVCPQESVLRLGGEVVKGMTRVAIFGDKVRKVTTSFTGGDLQNLYTELDHARAVPGLPTIENWKFRGPKLTLDVSPVGYCGERFAPQNVACVKAAGRRILLALQYLHSISWVHRDLRPANIMWSGEEWFLIDLEWANHNDTATGRYSPQEEWTPPEITGDDCNWTTASDMWQFGKLLHVWGKLDDDGRTYVQSQLSNNPETRLSASASLDHAFFQAS